LNVQKSYCCISVFTENSCITVESLYNTEIQIIQFLYERHERSNDMGQFINVT